MKDLTTNAGPILNKCALADGEYINRKGIDVHVPPPRNTNDAIFRDDKNFLGGDSAINFKKGSGGNHQGGPETAW